MTRSIRSTSLRSSVSYPVSWPGAHAQDQTGASDPDATYRVILYLAEAGAPTELSFQRLNEVVGEADGANRIRQLLEASSVQQLEGVTILPGGDTPTLKIGNVTVRVGHLQGTAPGRDVPASGGRRRQGGFREGVVSRFDESLVIAYPLTEGELFDHRAARSHAPRPRSDRHLAPARRPLPSAGEQGARSAPLSWGVESGSICCVARLVSSPATYVKSTPRHFLVARLASEPF